jgi:hypothetical protein
MRFAGALRHVCCSWSCCLCCCWRLLLAVLLLLLLLLLSPPGLVVNVVFSLPYTVKYTCSTMHIARDFTYVGLHMCNMIKIRMSIVLYCAAPLQDGAQHSTGGQQRQYESTMAAHQLHHPTKQAPRLLCIPLQLLAVQLPA